jgi:hypothetical protein
MTEKYRSSNSTDPSDEPAKMVRAEKEGATLALLTALGGGIRPPVILSERELKI